MWTWLSRAVADGLIKVEGTGRKANPFRYWLQSTEERWRQDPLHDFLEQQARELKLPFVSLREHKRRQIPDRSGDAGLADGGGIWPPGAPVE